MKSNENRIFYFDEIRALAILLVILCHIGQFFPNTIENFTSITSLLYMNIGRLGVPLFFMLSGALLLNKNYSISEFLKKRLSRVILPAVFWIILSILIYSTYVPYDSNFFINWFNNCGFLWFVFAIIGIYLVIPIFNSFIKEHGIKACEYFLIIWIILLILNYFNATEGYFLDFLFNNVGIYIGYAVLGYYLTNKDFNILSGPMIIFNTIILAAFLYVTVYLTQNYVVLIDYLSLIIIVECSALILILRYIHKYSLYKTDKALSRIYNFIKDSWIGKFIYIISLCSYGMYFLNSILIKYLSNTIIINSFDMMPLLFVLMSVLSFFIMFVLSYIPVVNRIIGIRFK